MKKLILIALLHVFLQANAARAAGVVTDWGTISAPIASDVTFEFGRLDITKNFTDQYLFSLAGSSGVEYTLSFNILPCLNGCGNPDLNWGIYDQNGGLVSAPANGTTYTLSSGSYSFQVKGTGMGAGNDLSYNGDITFSATALASGGMMASVPDGERWVLTAAGLLVFGWWRRRKPAGIFA